jgi:signal transduction histidine kinase/CheY-like chemotaxis protein/HPt (histidine-containing phosphotransfer) domain-containing protein
MSSFPLLQHVNNRLQQDFARIRRLVQQAALVKFAQDIDPGQVRAQQLRDLLILTPWMMAANLANATLVMLFFNVGPAQSALFTWSICVWLVAIRTLLGWRHSIQKAPRVSASTRGTMSVTRNAGMLGALWGVLPLIALPYGSLTEQVLATNIIAGMAAAGAFALATIPAAAGAYLFCILIPSMVGIAAGSIPASFTLLALCVVYFITICATIYARYREFGIRLQAESELRTQAQTISLLLNEFETQASDWLWKTDHLGQLTYVPDRFAQVAGIPRRNLMNKPISAAGSGAEHEPEWQDLTAKILRGVPVRNHDVPVGHRSSDRWWSITGAPVSGPDGTIVAYRGVGMDISARKQAELALAKNNQLLAEFNAGLEQTVAERTEDARKAVHEAEEANRAKSQFLANMSHEIRSPMNGVFGMTDLLLRTDLTSNQLRLVSTIQSSAQNLLSVINDILDISRIEAGKLEIDNHPFDLRHCLEGAVELFSESAARKGIGLSLWISPSTPDYVRGDKGRLRQVCVNLIGNAVKFSDTGEVSLRVETTTTGAGHKQLTITVRDRGIGMEPAALRKLCLPFTQADSSISRRYGGTGLGLSISHHLILLMGGTMQINSVVNEGTTITLELAIQECAAHTAQVRPKHVLPAMAKVLIVDDRATNREILNSYLTQAGASTYAVASGRLALAEIRRAQNTDTPYDVAVVDVVMPDMSGVEFLGNLRTELPESNLKTVLVTSMSWQGDIAQVRALGASALLTKPVRESELISCVAIAMAGEADTHDCQELKEQRVDLDQIQFNARVLVAEDNAINIEVARAFLKDFGCQVKTAENGRKALALMESQGFDVVLMDCQMPDMDGLTATRKIREVELANGVVRTPIIALTANAFEEDRRRCLAAGMDDYLSKPYTRQQLADVIMRCLRANPQRALDAHRAWDAAVAEPERVLSARSLEETEGLVLALTGAVNDMRALSPRRAEATPATPLELLIIDFGPDVAKDLMLLFVKDCEAIQRTLNVGEIVNDRPALTKLAHKLIGGASTVHAHALAKAARAVELCCQHSVEHPIDITEFRSEIATTLKTFKPLVISSELSSEANAVRVAL